MADNLESYFKKHLTKETPGEDQWNVPSDDVWEKVLPEISKKKGLFIPWKYLYILIVIILAGLAFILWPSANVDAPSDSNKTKTVQNDFKTPQNKLNNNLNTTGITDLEISSIENASNASIDIIDADNTTYRKTTQKDESLKNQSKDEDIFVSEEINTYQNADRIVFSDAYVPNKRALNFISSLKPESIFLPSKEIRATLLKKEPFAYSLPDNLEKKKPEPFNNKGKFGIGVFFKPTFTSTYLSGEMNTGFMETGNMYLYASNWGFEARYYLSNKFALVTGVEKSEVKSWSKSLVDFDYDISTEYLMENGEKENTSPVPMPTPFGEVDTEITYRFPAEEDIPDGETMNSVLETHQEVRYLSIPFGLEYNMLRFSHFNWFSEGGLAFNRALRDGTSFTSRILHEGHDMNVVSEIMTSHPTYTLNHLSFYIGTGVDYQFSKSIQINGSARYFRSITKVNLQDNLSTYVHGLNLKIGIVYIF
jgi:hypothetical protein